jgi:enoyl-CoA hydratase
MNSYEYLHVEESGSIAVVRIARPDERNALSRRLMRELLAVAQALKTRTDLQAIVLAGAPTYFTAGADLKDPERTESSRRTVLERREDARLGPDMCEAWEDLEQVTIAAIEGYCVGGGVALVVACDFRIAAENASLRLPEVPLGMNMSWGAIPRIVALVGPARAKRFVLFGEALDAATARGWGMVDDVVSRGRAETVAMEWAAKATGLPPVAMRMAKQAINATSGALNAATSFADRDQFLLATSMNDVAEGIGAFMEKRKGKFTGD